MNFSADSPLSEKAKVFPQFKQNPKEDIRVRGSINSYKEERKRKREETAKEEESTLHSHLISLSLFTFCSPSTERCSSESERAHSRTDYVRSGVSTRSRTHREALPRGSEHRSSREGSGCRKRGDDATMTNYDVINGKWKRKSHKEVSW